MFFFPNHFLFSLRDYVRTKLKSIDCRCIYYQFSVCLPNCWQQRSDPIASLDLISSNGGWSVSNNSPVTATDDLLKPKQFYTRKFFLPRIPETQATHRTDGRCFCQATERRRTRCGTHNIVNRRSLCISKQLTKQLQRADFAPIKQTNITRLNNLFDFFQKAAEVKASKPIQSHRKSKDANV